MPCIGPSPAAHLDAADNVPPPAASVAVPAFLPGACSVANSAADPAAASAAASEPAADLLANLLARARQERRLLSVHWELTHRCNEHCRHCFLPVTGPADFAARGELTTGEALHLIDQVAALGALSITFSGGEPLLRPDFFTLAAYARRRGLGLRIYTNGTLLAAPTHVGWIDALAALHPLAVEISLYGATPAVHEAITGIKGSWAATVAALRRLHAAGVRTVCKTPLMAANAAELPAVWALALSLGARFQADPLITAGVDGPWSTPAARRAPLAARMTAAQLANALRILASHQAAPGEDPGATAAGPVLCTIGRSALAVDPTGTVFPCVEVRRAVGSIRTAPLAAIWYDTRAWAPYLRLSAQGPAGLPANLPADLPPDQFIGVLALPVCRTCRLGAWCVRCHGAAANETGDLYGPSPAHCAAARARRTLAATRQQDAHSGPLAGPGTCDSG